MLRIGGTYLYRVGSFTVPIQFRIEDHNGTHWVARSLNNFETLIYVDDEGRHVGSRDFGMYETPVDVFLIFGDDDA